MLENKIKLPIVHIADATADALNDKHIKKAALLGTKYTLREDFYNCLLYTSRCV